ncbi:MAG: radical SAM protein [Candidatus Aminicenantes bacterium]|nr:radical SAM protein [Candidatus Aminicenantes bacterium]
MTPSALNTRRLSGALKVFFWNAVRIALGRPRQAAAFIRFLWWLRKSARRRAIWKRRGVQVPPIIIYSVTDRCNLACQGCYAQSFPQDEGTEFSAEDMRRMFKEARELGVSFFVLAGGEPLLRPELAGILAEFPEFIFLVFTNGLLLTDEWLSVLRRQPHIVPLLSLEGDRDMTDGRRGPGTYDKVQDAFVRLKRRGIFFGTSLTLTRTNFEMVTSAGLTRNLVQAGVKFFLYLEYTPTVEGTEGLVLAPDQRSAVRDILSSFRTGFPALFIAVPWDEDDVGGCLAAGRGFIHISAAGAVEPCPFAPFSDISLRDKPLREALRSNFLNEIRNRPELGRETGGGCVLWKERELVMSLLKQAKARSNPD